MAAGADVNAKDGLERTALSEAIRKNEEASRTNNNNSYKDIIAMLENAIANNTENNSSEESQEEKDKKLLDAAKNNELDEVREALDAGADVDAMDNDGNTTLHLASNYGHTEIVEKLLENRADVNARNGYWMTALDVAIRKGHTDIIVLLKKAMGIKEENFIVDKFCKEATYLDVIEGEVTKNIQEYLQEDKDNIMLIYKSNKADTDLEYFGTTRPIITNAFKDKINLFFGCILEKSVLY